jgi:hypothetical protein
LNLRKDNDDKVATSHYLQSAKASKMTQQQIDGQLTAESLVLYPTRGRTIAFAAVVLVASLFLGYQAAHAPMGIWWACNLLVCALLAYMGLAAAFDTVRGVPLLQTSDSGISINSFLGHLFVRWPDTVGFTEGIFPWWLRIRQRDGAQPSGSIVTRILNKSLWARSTIAVPLFTTERNASEIAKTLTQIQSRKLALND